MVTDESLILFDGKGLCVEGIIKTTSKNEGSIEILHDRTEDFLTRRRYRLTVAFAPTKNIDRTEFAVEKLVELGVDEISMLECYNSERSHLRLDRIEKIALSAAKQSRKSLLPVIHDLIAPGIFVSQYKRDHPATSVFCCHLDASSTPLVENYLPGQDVLVLIGPEGGFSNEETEQLAMRGAKMVTLGPHRLRVETAAIAACQILHTLNDLKKTT
jgi:16S rRNA (uracil1498-N3)-methyltransferase